MNNLREDTDGNQNQFRRQANHYRRHVLSIFIILLSDSIVPCNWILPLFVDEFCLVLFLRVVDLLVGEDC